MEGCRCRVTWPVGRAARHQFRHLRRRQRVRDHVVRLGRGGRQDRVAAATGGVAQLLQSGPPRDLRALRHPNDQHVRQSHFGSAQRLTEHGRRIRPRLISSVGHRGRRGGGELQSRPDGPLGLRFRTPEPATPGSGDGVAHRVRTDRAARELPCLRIEHRQLPWAGLKLGLRRHTFRLCRRPSCGVGDPRSRGVGSSGRAGGPHRPRPGRNRCGSHGAVVPGEHQRRPGMESGAQRRAGVGPVGSVLLSRRRRVDRGGPRRRRRCDGCVHVARTRRGG